jgi:hypothetical protein
MVVAVGATASRNQQPVPCADARNGSANTPIDPISLARLVPFDISFSLLERDSAGTLEPAARVATMGDRVKSQEPAEERESERIPYARITG